MTSYSELLNNLPGDPRCGCIDHCAAGIMVAEYLVGTNEKLTPEQNEEILNRLKEFKGCSGWLVGQDNLSFIQKMVLGA